MTKKATPIQAKADLNLVQSMQRAVAGIASQPASGKEANSQEPPGREVPGTHHGSHATASNTTTTGRSGVQKRNPRASVSMPTAVAEHVRRLAMALTIYEAHDISLGTTVSRALALLEEELRAAGVTIPDAPVKLRSGPRHV